MAAKFIAYGVSHSVVNILISYPRHHKQRVKIGSDTSYWMTILKGIPQGSILGRKYSRRLYSRISQRGGFSHNS